VTERPATIPVAPALGTWALSWVLGAIVLTPLLVAAVGGSLGDDLSIPELTIATAGVWAVFVVGLVTVSRRSGSGSFRADLGIAFRPVDLVGVPIGVLAQFVLVPALYWPLSEIWPTTFDTAKIEERAQDLADRAGGVDTVLLVVVVVVGAPIVEELVYRGLIQRSLAASAGRVTGLLLTSALFSLIHFSPVEYPGLFLAGLVFGGGLSSTGRLGAGILAHAAFNAAGLVMVLS
jgi:membrane protease YdiL (CAAX protease family)